LRFWEQQEILVNSGSEAERTSQTTVSIIEDQSAYFCHCHFSVGREKERAICPTLAVCVCAGTHSLFPHTHTHTHLAVCNSNTSCLMQFLIILWRILSINRWN